MMPMGGFGNQNRFGGAQFQPNNAFRPLQPPPLQYNNQYGHPQAPYNIGQPIVPMPQNVGVGIPPIQNIQV
jgi:hypothetical protein